MGASRGRVKGSRTRVEDSKAIERVMRVRREAERRGGSRDGVEKFVRTTTELDVDDGDEEEDEEEVNTACGSRVVLARAWPAPGTEDVVALSKRVWISMGRPPAVRPGVAKRDEEDDDEDVDGLPRANARASL